MITMTETNKELLTRLFACINSGDFAPLELHPGFHETRRYVPPMHQVFADWQTGLMQQIAEGDLVFSYCAVQLTHIAPFAGLEPGGKRVSLEVLSFDQVRAGIVVEHNSTSTWPEVLRQLGSPAFQNWPARSPQLLQTNATATTTTNPSDNKLIVGQLLAALGRGDLAVARKYDSRGRLVHEFGTLRAAFPDLTLTPVVQIAEGDLVASRATLTGTHQGKLYGIPASGQIISWDFFMLARVASGMVVDQRSSADWNTALMQLGILAL